jgi:hypothetical protein
MQLNVTNKADTMLRAVCTSWLFMVLEKISSKIASEIIKITRGNKKAITTLTTTEGPLVFPN